MAASVPTACILTPVNPSAYKYIHIQNMNSVLNQIDPRMQRVFHIPIPTMRDPKPVLAFLTTIMICSSSSMVNGVVMSSDQPLVPGEDSITVPALPVVQQQKEKCHLDLSDELFGGVKEACGEGKTLDRSRCCPVLAAWLYAAHARAALQPAAPPAPSAAGDQPLLPDNSQTCVNSLQASLKTRGIDILRPNATCDTILCFCGIRLHQLSSLTCTVSFNLTPTRHNNARKPTISALHGLETNCTDPSYQGCTRCLKTIEKLKGRPGKKEGYSERTSRMYSRDCELMGLTWLLAKNKTAYIPTVSAVLRALMYSTHQSHCSPDQENMPLAVDSVELSQSSSSYSIVWRNPTGFMTLFCTLLVLLFLRAI